MRSIDGKPHPTLAERQALFRFLLSVSDALSLVHGPRPPKPKNIEPGWLPPQDWTPEADEAGGDDEESGQVLRGDEGT